MKYNIESEEERLATDLAISDRELLMDLVRLRRSLRMSQEEVATRMGIKQPTLAKFESMDSDPKLSTLRRYALALGALVRHEITHPDRNHANGEWHSVPVSAPVSPFWGAGILHHVPERRLENVSKPRYAFAVVESTHSESKFTDWRAVGSLTGHSTLSALTNDRELIDG